MDGLDVSTGPPLAEIEGLADSDISAPAPETKREPVIEDGLEDSSEAAYTEDEAIVDVT